MRMKRQPVLWELREPSSEVMVESAGGCSCWNHSVNSGGSGQRGGVSPSCHLIPPWVLWLPSLWLVWASFPVSPLRMSCSQLQAVERTRLDLSGQNSSPSFTTHWLCDWGLMAYFK